MFKLVFVALFAILANASSLSFQNGFIQAHTEVFGDSNINPATNKITSSLTMDEHYESLKGTVSLETLALKSDNDKRDANMYELLNATLHPQVSFEMTNVSKNGDEYTVEGNLTLNGVKAPVSSKAIIKEEGNKINLFGNFSILLSSYGMKPPKLLFLTVQDQIDITYTLNYMKGE